MENKECEQALKESVKLGWVKDHGDGTFSLTKKGKKYIEGDLLPSLGVRPKELKEETGLRRALMMIEQRDKKTEAEISEALGVMVKHGKLVKIMTHGEIGWIDSRSKKPRGAIILEGKFVS